jgi:hypothetical protein
LNTGENVLIGFGKTASDFHGGLLSQKLLEPSPQGSIPSGKMTSIPMTQTNT